MEDAIKRLELEALRVKYGADAIICSKCGSPNRSDARFCMSCGSGIVKEEVQGRICHACGASIREGAKFCMRCGVRIE